METQNLEKLEREINPTLEKVTALQITTNEESINAGELDKQLKGLEKKITDELGPQVRKAYSLYKDLKSQLDRFINPVQASRKMLKSKIGAYLIKKQAEADAEQRRIDAERRKAEKAEKDRIQAEIDKANESGDKEKAKELRQEKKAVYVAPVAMAEQPETAKGVSIQRMRYFVEIKDESIVPRQFCKPHLPSLNEEARRTEGKVKIAGCIVRSEPIVGTR